MQASESGDRPAGINGGVQDRLVRYSSKPALKLSAAMPAHEALRKIHLSLLRAILHNQAGVLGSRDPEFLHLLEFFRSLYPGREAASLIKRLKSLQDVLGDIHDLAVHREMARSIWTDIRPRPESSMPLDLLERRLGQLHVRAHGATEGKFQRFRAHATPW